MPNEKVIYRSGLFLESRYFAFSTVILLQQGSYIIYPDVRVLLALHVRPRWLVVAHWLLLLVVRNLRIFLRTSLVVRFVG